MMVFRNRGFLSVSRHNLHDCRLQDTTIMIKRRIVSKSLSWPDDYTPLDLHFRVFQGKISSLPVVICHGMLGTHRNWSLFGKQINERTGKDVYLPDMRNHGSSPHSDSMSYYDMASDVNNFIKTHKLGNVVLIGHSMGGRIALLLSLLNPSVVDQLIIVDSSPVDSTTEKGISDIERFLSAISKVDLTHMVKKNMDRLAIKQYIDETLMENGIKNESRRQWLMMNLITKKVGGQELYDWNFNFDVLQNSLRPNLILVPQDALTCDSLYPKKTLFIGSPISNYIPRDSHDEIKKYFTNAEFVYIDGAGHWIQADKPKEFISVVLKFLAS